MLFGKISLVAAALLLIGAPLRAMAEDAAAPPAAELSAEDLISTKDAVGEEAKRRAQEERDIAKQFIDSLRPWLAEAMRLGLFCDPTFDVQRWNREVDRAKQALDEGKPLPEVYAMVRELQNEVRRARDQKHAAHLRGRASDVTLPEAPETEEAKNSREKLLRSAGRVRLFLELADLLMNLTDSNSNGCGD
jgi:hypothetical protein